MKKQFTFAAIFEYGNDGISVHFPDLDEAYTDGKTTEDAMKNAQEVLTLTLRSRVKDNETIPEPTDLSKIALGKGKYTVLVMAAVDEKVKYDKKTLTVPHDLNVAAEEAGLNFSQVLTDALKQKLADI